jgi:DNA-directed RNA polymerase subunit E'/Rpb7
MKYINSITPLPTLDVEKLTVGETLTWIIKNTNNNLTHIALGENVSWAIKTNGEALDMKPGEKIQVKIINISKKDKNKTRIELQVA